MKDALTRRCADAGVRGLVHYGDQRYTCLSNQDLDIVRGGSSDMAVARGISNRNVGLGNAMWSSVNKRERSARRQTSKKRACRDKLTFVTMCRRLFLPEGRRRGQRSPDQPKQRGKTFGLSLDTSCALFVSAM